ncbi:CPBP family intramembrane glutamic endopeptidase [Synechococcus sp. PCC 7336]|uniref:CPBP family intramembrane glutamic endopeptidase n=1 Tax=Synechococcus sp. PCC 7336 TaxID=195250 RepID=UPI000475CA3D|nr:CPBP family intramembrane glutamic endopeptidase [Synechococcus sp. PCC 7336]
MNETETPPLSRQQVLVAMGATALLLGAIAKLWIWLGRVQLMPATWHPLELLAGVGLGLAIVGLSRLLYWLWPRYRTCAEQYMTTIVQPLAWPDLIWLGLLPSVSEELLFRGVALGAFGLTPLAIALTSIAFGSLHLMDLKQWPYGIWAMVIGALFGTSLLLTGNLLVPIVSHSVANLLSSYLWKHRWVGQNS